MADQRAGGVVDLPTVEQFAHGTSLKTLDQRGVEYGAIFDADKSGFGRGRAGSVGDHAAVVCACIVGHTAVGLIVVSGLALDILPIGAILGRLPLIGQLTLAGSRKHGQSVGRVGALQGGALGLDRDGGNGQIDEGHRHVGRVGGTLVPVFGARDLAAHDERLIRGGGAGDG